MTQLITRNLGSDRFLALLLILVSALLYGLLGELDEPRAPGQISAATYPRLLLLGLILFNAILMLKPGTGETKQARFPLKGVMVIAVITLYIALLEVAGYFVLTPLLLISLPLIAGFRKPGLILFSVALVTLSLYAIFVLVLEIPLPTGFIGS